MFNNNERDKMKQNPVTLQWSGEYDSIGQKIPEITCVAKGKRKLPQKEERLHKYIGFHNTEQVCNTESNTKDSAKKLCEDMLLKYFHELQDNVTRFPLENYNGEVAYVGSVRVVAVKNEDQETEYKKNNEQQTVEEFEEEEQGISNSNLKELEEELQ